MSDTNTEIERLQVAGKKLCDAITRLAEEQSRGAAGFTADPADSPYQQGYEACLTTFIGEELKPLLAARDEALAAFQGNPNSAST